MMRLILPALLVPSAFGLHAQTSDTTTQWRTMVTGWRVGPPTYQLNDTMPSMAATRIDGSGASLVLRSSAAGPAEVGSVSASVPAHAFRGRRVQVSAELRTRAATGGGSLWVRADGTNGSLALDNGQAVMLTGNTDWRTQELTLDVPREAVRIVFGGLLRGTGELSLRRLLVTPRDLPAAHALAVFDSAVVIMRAHALVRDTVSWDVVIPVYRGRLAGATKREDAYPVVALLARRLGDHHSFFRPPMPIQRDWSRFLSSSSPFALRRTSRREPSW